MHDSVRSVPLLQGGPKIVLQLLGTVQNTLILFFFYLKLLLLCNLDPAEDLVVGGKNVLYLIIGYKIRHKHVSFQDTLTTCYFVRAALRLSFE